MTHPKNQMSFFSNATAQALMPRQPWFYAVLGSIGIFVGFTNPLAHIPYGILLFPIALYSIASQADTRKKVLLHCWISGALGYSCSLYWLAFPLHDVGGLPYILTIPCITLLGSYLGVYTALAGLCVYELQRSHLHEGKTGIFFPILEPLLAGCSFVGIEQLCGSLLTGFPWFPLASAFAFLPSHTQLAAFIGASGISAFLASSGYYLAYAMHASSRRLSFYCIGCILVLLLPLAGSIRLAYKEKEQPGNAFYAVLVQGNIDQNQKWTHDSVQLIVDKYIRLTNQALQRATQQNIPIDLVIWPETALPFSLQRPSIFAQQVRSFISDTQTPFAIGNVAYGTAGNSRNTLYNRLLFLNSDGTDFGSYDKYHLVPFGEYIPFASSLSFLQNIMQGVAFIQGDSIHPVSLPQKSNEESVSPPLALGGLICYETIFPYIAQEQVDKGATFFLTISNDAWFGKSSAPYQLLGLSALRCVEQERAMLRATNTGISAVISPYGEISQFGQLFTDNAAIASVFPKDSKTTFHYVYLLLSIFFYCTAFFALLNRFLLRSR